MNLKSKNIKERSKYMHLGFKYRVYPTEEQKVFFAKSFGCCRKVWNLMLAELAITDEKAFADICTIAKNAK